MFKLEDEKMNDNTRFVTGIINNDVFVFEVKNGHLISASILSSHIEEYKNLLSGEKYGSDSLQAGENARHDMVHKFFYQYTSDNAPKHHDHFASKNQSIYEGMHMLPYLSVKLGEEKISDIRQLIQSTAPY